MADDNFSRTFFLGSLFLLLILSIIVIFPFMTPIISAAILAYIAHPAYKYLAQKTKRKRIAAGIMVFLLIIFITIPMYFVVSTLSKEGYTLFITVKQTLAAGSGGEVDCLANPAPFCELNNKISEILSNPQFKFYVEDGIGKLSSFIIEKTSLWIVNLPLIIVDFIIMFFVTYYFLLDGTRFVDKIRQTVPLKSHHIDEIITQFDNFTYATLYGNLITALIQGAIGGIIFFALGLPAPLLAGLAMAFFAFLPVIGTPIVWIPAVISLFVAGSSTKAIILLLLGVFVISSIDNILKPQLIGKRTKLHAAAVLVGIAGGIFTMGLIGILIGPLVISLFISFIDVYYKEELIRK